VLDKHVIDINWEMMTVLLYRGYWDDDYGPLLRSLASLNPGQTSVLMFHQSFDLR